MLKNRQRINVRSTTSCLQWSYASVLSILLLLSLMALTAAPALAGTPITLYKTFAGNLNYVTTGGTLRTEPNSGNSCAVTTGPVSASLSGIPAGATIRAAYLYWAGSGSTPDFDVTFNGNNLSADRTFTENFNNGTSYDFFSGFKDVTPYVTGNGTFTFSNLSVNNGAPFCGVSAVLSGWALVVIYSNTSLEPLRVINVYDGFRYFYGSAITLNPTNFRIPATGIDGKHTHITWEGDVENSGSNGGYNENFTFNGNPLTDSFNPSNNQFNSTINTLSSDTSYGVDIDTFNVSSYLAPGAGSATTVYSSGADLVLLNAEVLSVTNTAVADLSIVKSHNGSFPTGGSGTFQLQVRNNGPSTATGTAGNPIIVTDTIPAGLSYSTSSGSGWTVDTSSLPTVRWRYVGTVPASTDFPPITLQVTATAAPGSAITNTASVSGPDFDHDLSNNDSSDTVNVSFPVGSGNKPLYLYGSGDGYKLSRTPTPGTPGSVTLTEGSSQTWTLNPLLQLNSTLSPAVGSSVPVGLFLARTGFSSSTTRSVYVSISCSSGGATLSQSLTIGNTTPTLTNFSLPLAAVQTCPAGGSWQLTVTNNSSGSGSRNLDVYPVYGGNISQVILPTTTVIDVASVGFYNGAYPGGSTITSAAPGSTVYMRTTVTDPFGSYDISGATITITDGSSTVRVNGAPMNQVADSGAASKIYQYIYTVPAASPTGNWTVRVVSTEGTEGTITDDLSATLPVAEPPRLEVAKEVSTDGSTWVVSNVSVAPSTTTIYYRVTVDNKGSSDATSVVITDPLPIYTTYVNGSARQATGAPVNYGTASALTDANDGDGYDFGVSSANTATYNVGTIKPGSGNAVQLFFQLRVN